MRYFAAYFLIAASLMGCAAVPAVDSQPDGALKTSSVVPDRSAIFMYRDDAVGTKASIGVYLDGASLGRLADKSYIYREVTPGRHTVVSKAENIATLDLNVEAGSLAFVRQEVTPGKSSQRSELHLISEAEAMQQFLKFKPGASKDPMQVVEVRVQADDPAWVEALDCVARNALGSWSFVAPGHVQVAASIFPLLITCKVNSGVQGPTGEIGGTALVSPQNVHKGLSTGEKAGAVALDMALGLVAGPLAPPITALLFAGAGFGGAQSGRLASAVTSIDTGEYPSPVVLRIKRRSSPD